MAALGGQEGCGRARHSDQGLNGPGRARRPPLAQGARGGALGAGPRKAFRRPGALKAFSWLPGCSRLIADYNSVRAAVMAVGRPGPRPGPRPPGRQTVPALLCVLGRRVPARVRGYTFLPLGEDSLQT